MALRLGVSARRSFVRRMASERPLRVVGIQSGNAVDGIDVGIFDFPAPTRDAADPKKIIGPINYKVLANKTFSFTPEQRKYVLRLRTLGCEDGNDYAEANYKMGEWMGDNANALLKEADIDPSTVHLMSSHGQTISGHPHWEIGDLSVIAQRTRITTVGDFRTADVGAGGNGTPATCTYDSIMLRPDSGTQWRVGVNIGGTSSVTFLPPRGAKDSAGNELVPHGLDPGLGVFFMDLAVEQIDPTLEYDANGDIAASGTVHEGLMAEMLTYKYYQQPKLPIGVGPDDFPETLFHKWHARAKELGVNNVDFLATLTEQSSKQIALACSRFGGPNITGGNCADVILRGGVVNNKHWVRRLLFHMSEQLGKEFSHIRTLDEIGIDEESWENAMYAMFGYLCYNNLYNFVPSCTGASRHVVGGKICPGDNWGQLTLLNR
jgi:anhydro-N-acetylmuramic acid kinase